MSSSAAMNRPSKIFSRIVLMGGGHSHIQFLRSWRMRPLPGVEVILISKDAVTPYSGMLPARLAGWYSDAEMHFDLSSLCAQSGATFLADEVTGLDARRKKIFLRERPEVVYDFASLNVGITPWLPPGAAGHPHVLAVKPIAQLLAKWEKLRERFEASTRPWVVVGGGAAGFEVARILALLFARASFHGKILLLQSSTDLLPGMGAGVAARARRILQEAGVEIRLNSRVTEVRGQSLLCASGAAIEFAEVLLTTGAQAPAWFAASGLPVSDRGFIRVDSELKVEGLDSLYAAGDCAEFMPRALPKSGVYAVREGPVLSENLRRSVLGKKLIKFNPQRHTLALLTSGERRALLSYRGWHRESAWLWRWKDRIDQGFMERFGVRSAAPMAGEHNTCGGCGGKVAAEDVRVLVEGLRARPDFAALLPPGVEDIGQVGDIATSIDGFRSFSRDHYFFAQVATWHALNDLFASGVKPQGLNVYAGLPEAKGSLRQNHLLHLMSGVLKVLAEQEIPLLNAHSAEATETTLVLVPLGAIHGPLWKKGGLEPGDQLILTKPLGTGALLQAQMAGSLPVHALAELEHCLLQHHGRVADTLHEFNIRAGTDVTGFGLLGHLSEMAVASGAGIELLVKELPLLRGFRDVSRAGFRSFIANENQAAFFALARGVATPLDGPELWDPQTNGPLVIGALPAQVPAVLERLKALGFARAAVIGQVVRGEPLVHVL